MYNYINYFLHLLKLLVLLIDTKVTQNINFLGNILKHDAREKHLTYNLELKIRSLHQRYISS